MKHDNSPATKADLAELHDRLLDQVNCRLSKIRVEMISWKDELAQHFDVVIENLKHDVLAANREMIEVLKDRSASHERRLRRLEAFAGFVD